jgi:hypothetical protein
MRNILRVHMDTCLQPGIAKSPFPNVQKILLSREQRAVTDAVGYGSALVALHSRDQIIHNAVFHGHADNGILDGKTSTGIPIYNVSALALRKTGKPYRVVEFRASVSGANRSERFLSHHAPCFYIGAALCG